MYIQQAENVVHGAPINSSGYIYNPLYPQLGPRAYPPLYPLLLAPLYWKFGFNLTAMKVETIFFLLLGLMAVYCLFSHFLFFQDVMLLIAILGFNPYFWESKDRVGSDLPFFAILMATLFLIVEIQDSKKNSTRHALLLGLAIYLCYATRTIGLVLVACLVATDLIKLRAVSKITLIASGTAAILFVLQALIFPGAESYADQLHFSALGTYSNLKGYFWEAHTSIWPCFGSAASWILSIALIALGVTGFAVRVARNISVIEVFMVLYVGTILSWPAGPDARFLIPVVPVWLYYVISATRDIAVRWFRPIGMAAGLIVVFGSSYASGYASANYGPIRQGIGDPDFLAVCDYIKSHTSTSDVIVFAKPRILALVTGRKSTAYYQPPLDSTIWRFISNTSAHYILIGFTLKTEGAVLESFINRQGPRLEMVFHNSGFGLYRIRDD